MDTATEALLERRRAFYQQPKVIEDMQRLGLEIDEDLVLWVRGNAVCAKIFDDTRPASLHTRYQAIYLKLEVDRVEVCETSQPLFGEEGFYGIHLRTVPEEGKYLLIRDPETMAIRIEQDKTVRVHNTWLRPVGHYPYN